MNGDRTAEEWAQSAAMSAQRATQKADAAANAVLKCEQTVGRMEREVGDLRREMNDGFTEIADQIRKLGPYRTPGARPAHVSITEEDWEDSPTGTHKMVSKRTFDAWQKQRETSAEAKRWRKALDVSGKIALAMTLVILGFLVRHFLGGLFK